MKRAALGSALVLGLVLGLSGTGTAGGNPRASGFEVERWEASRQAPIGMLATPAPPPQEVAPVPAGPRRRHTRRPRRATQPLAPMPVPVMPAMRDQPRVGLDALDLAPLPEFSPALTLNFEALLDDEAVIPPGTHGAVGPTKVVTVLNTRVRVQNRDGSQVSTTPLDTFWSPVATAGVFGPRALYDPDPAYGTGRWIWVAVQGARAAESGILVAASTGEEPTGGPGVLVDVDDTDTVWADYPSVGFNRKWVVVQVNLYLRADDTWDSTHIYVFDKAKLYAGTATGGTLFYSSIDGASQVPAATYDFTTEQLYLLQTWSPGAGQLQLLELDGPVESETLTPVGFPTTDPWADVGDGSLDFAPQAAGPPGCTACTPPCKIQTNDSRIQNVVYRGGTLWATQTVFLTSPTRSSVQWWQIDTGATVLQRGLVDDPVGAAFYAFPSVAVNRHGDVLLGYSSFEGAEYAGARYSFRNAFDEANKLRKELRLKDGKACYFRDEGAGNRWGDYSAAVVDPFDDTGLWTIQEYAETPVSNVDHWGTWWGMLDLTRTLSIADVSVDEGDTGPTALTFTITLSEPTTETVDVEWATADDTATTADGDYVAVANGSVTFNPGDTTATVTVTVNGDLTHEADETLFVNLSNPSGAALANTQAKGTILNDDPMPKISIGDVVLAEGSGNVVAGTAFSFPVTLSNPSSQSVQASWGTLTGTAVPGPTLAEDYVSNTGSITFLPGEVSLTIVVQVHADEVIEADETFSVVLSLPSGGTLLKDQGVGTILNDDATNPDVEGLAVTSDGPPVVASGRDRLQWQNPSGGNPTGIRISWEESGVKCATYPSDSATVTAQTVDLTFDGPGVQRWDHTGLTLDTFYCYTVWINHSGVYSAGRSAMGQPFNVGGRTKWKYFTGATAVAPPTVGLDGVLSPSNDNLVHSMERGPTGGAWPPSWNPVSLGSPAQQRSPIVPLGGVSRAYFATQDGRVHAVNAKTGVPLWSVLLSPAAAQGAPAGIFTAWGGVGDYILVGTRALNNNLIYALDPFTGAVIDTFPQAGDGVTDLGAINGMGTVDYADGVVYFTSWGTAGSPETVWCLELGPPSDALSLKWKKEKEGLIPLGNITGSPVKRGNRIYVGNDSGRVWAIDATNGATAYYFDTSDPGPVDFVFPDRGSTALYFSSANYVWGLLDDGSALTEKWTLPVVLVGSNPSAVLLRPGTKNLYVGVENLLGQPGLLEIDVSLGDPNSLVLFHPLEANPVVMGAPSLDIGHDLVHIGSEAGILYAVQVPF